MTMTPPNSPSPPIIPLMPRLIITILLILRGRRAIITFRGRRLVKAARFMVYTTHCAVQVSIRQSAREAQHAPFEDFFPQPSLSTTSSPHATRGPRRCLVGGAGEGDPRSVSVSGGSSVRLASPWESWAVRVMVVEESIVM